VRGLTIPQSVVFAEQVWSVAHETVELEGFNNHQQFAEVPVLVQVTVKLLGTVLLHVRTGVPKLTTGGVKSDCTEVVNVAGIVLEAATAGIALLRATGDPITV